MIKTDAEKKPLVYSCSGCSSAAQMTNYLAIQLDRRGIAEMSCIAGVGGNVKKLLRTAQSGRKIIVIDGCPLACSYSCLQNHNIRPELNFELTSFGVEKKYHEDFDLDEAEKILVSLESDISKGKEKINGTTYLLNKVIDKKQNAILTLVQNEIIIKEVLNKKQLAEFIDLPYRLYKGNKYFVPQIKKDTEATFNKSQNPAFEFCEARYWLAYKNGRLAGRIAGIINHACNKKWNQQYLRFGWMDFEEDQEIANELLQKVEVWAREKNMKAVQGPLGFTNFDYAGFLIEGFDQLGTFATIYNYPYYSLFLEKAGYTKNVDWVEYKLKVPDAVPEKLVKMASVVERRNNLTVLRPVSKKEIMPYAKDIFHLLNAVYADLFGMVELNDKQIEYSIKKYLSFIRADFVSLVLDKNNELAAFGIAMPSLSKALQKAKGNLYPFGFLHLLRVFRKNGLADLCLVAVRKDLQGKGVNAILMNEINKSFLKNGIQYAESNPELEENTKVQSLWAYYNAVQHKRRRCYIKKI